MSKPVPERHHGGRETVPYYNGYRETRRGAEQRKRNKAGQPAG